MEVMLEGIQKYLTRRMALCMHALTGPEERNYRAVSQATRGHTAWQAGCMGKRLCHAAQSARHNTLVPKRTEPVVLTAAQEPLPGCKQVRMPLTRAGMKGLAPLWSGSHWSAGRKPAQVSHELRLL